MIGTTRSRVSFFMNKFRKFAGFASFYIERAHCRVPKMKRHDQDLLDRQMKRIQPRPRHNGLMMMLCLIAAKRLAFALLEAMARGRHQR
jgi:hypothetical protein